MIESAPSPEASHKGKGKKAALGTGAVVLTGALAVGGVSPAAAEPLDENFLESAARVNHMANVTLNPDEAALDEGKIELHPSAHEYEPTDFQYDPELTCHARDVEWLEANGQPSAYIQFVYERAGIDPETATLDQKIAAYKDAMWDCYPKDPYIFASTLLALEHSNDGVKIDQDMINAYGDELIADPARWQKEVEGLMSLFESPDNTCSVGKAEAGKHNSLYTSNIDSADGHYRIYMGGASHITSDVLILGLPNGQMISFKECLQPAWVGDELHIDGIPHLVMDLPVLDPQLCEPGAPPIIVPPIIPPVHFADRPTIDRPVPPMATAPTITDVVKPDYAAMTGTGTSREISKTHQGYADVARSHKQPTFLNNGNFSGNRSGRGRTSTRRTPNARRGNTGRNR